MSPITLKSTILAASLAAFALNANAAPVLTFSALTVTADSTGALTDASLYSVKSTITENPTVVVGTPVIDTVILTPSAPGVKGTGTLNESITTTTTAHTTTLKQDQQVYEVKGGGLYTGDKSVELTGSIKNTTSGAMSISYMLNSAGNYKLGTGPHPTVPALPTLYFNFGTADAVQTDLTTITFATTPKSYTQTSGLYTFSLGAGSTVTFDAYLGTGDKVSINDFALTFLGAGTSTLVDGMPVKTISTNSTPVTFAALPVPEPETYAMLLAGLGLLGFMARRKKNAA